jgi:hypothetical protein
MTANEFVSPGHSSRKLAAPSRGQDANQKLLTALAIFTLTASMIFVGIFMVALVQAMPTISLVMRGQRQ